MTPPWYSMLFTTWVGFLDGIHTFDVPDLSSLFKVFLAGMPDQWMHLVLNSEH